MSKKMVCVITGGGSGMGLATAKQMPKGNIIVVAGRTAEKLENAVKELEELGYVAHAFVCDTSKLETVKALAKYAESLGEIKTVINAAGVSPHMEKSEQILRINALGTLHINQEFSKVMNAGSVIVDISSNSAYVFPGFIVPTKLFPLAESDEEQFIEKILGKVNILKHLSNVSKDNDEIRKAGVAYAMSKTFVVWYAKKTAIELGPKGIRVCSVAPGLVDTHMGELEKEDGKMMIDSACEKRMGKPEELAFAIATIADERNGYLAGVDVLIDNGATTHQNEFKKM